MPSPNRKCKKDGKCQDRHCFSMRSIHTDTYYRNPVQILLCPSLDRNGQVIAHSFPVFNRDNRVHTPAFCLDIDRNYSIDQDQQMFMDHVRKIKDSLENKHQILLPKPSHKSKYCSVCKDSYDDYKEHIESSSHKKSIQKSKFNKYVGELCDMFKNTQPTQEQKQQTYVIEDDDELPPIRKIQRVESTICSPEEKLQAQPSSTNISSLNRQTPYVYSPYTQFSPNSSNMIRYPHFLPYYAPGMGYWPTLPFSPSSFYSPEMKYPPMFPFYPGPMYSCNNMMPMFAGN